MSSRRPLTTDDPNHPIDVRLRVELQPGPPDRDDPVSVGPDPESLTRGLAEVVRAVERVEPGADELRIASDRVRAALRELAVARAELQRVLGNHARFHDATASSENRSLTDL